MFIMIGHFNVFYHMSKTTSNFIYYCKMWKSIFIFIYWFWFLHHNRKNYEFPIFGIMNTCWDCNDVLDVGWREIEGKYRPLVYVKNLTMYKIYCVYVLSMCIHVVRKKGIFGIHYSHGHFYYVLTSKDSLLSYQFNVTRFMNNHE